MEELDQHKDFVIMEYKRNENSR